MDENSTSLMSSLMSSSLADIITSTLPDITTSTLPDIMTSSVPPPPSVTTPSAPSLQTATTSALILPKNTTLWSDISDMLENSTLFNQTTDLTTENVLINRTSNETPFYLKFRDEPWVIPLVSVALLNVSLIILFEIYVLYKCCGGKRHLFLGQVLLLGLLLSSLLALVYVPEPHWLLCGITRGGIGILYSVVFGVLLVKCVFLLKFHYGIYFNASVQALFLFFIIAVEIAIVTQWITYHPPSIESYVEPGSTMTVVCDLSPLDRIPYLTYVMLLMFMVIVGSIRARSLRENNREAMYIGLSIAFALVIWVAWTSVSIIFDRKYEAPAEALGLVSTSLLVFLLIFVPKAVQLARGKGRQHSASTGSRSMVHTPSFLQLQPHAVLPSSGQGTLVKQSQLNADYCRNGYSSRLWRYDYPSFHQMEPPPIAISDMNSTKKSNGSSHHHSHVY